MLSYVLDSTSYVFSAQAVPAAVTGVVVMVLGLLTLVQERGSRVAVPFTLMAVALSIWCIGIAVMYSTESVFVAAFWAHFAHLGLVYFPAAAYFFTVRVVDHYAYGQNRLWVAAAISSVFAVLSLAHGGFLREPLSFAWGFHFQYGPVGSAFLLYLAGMLGIAMRLYVRAYLNAESGTAMQRRAGMLLLGLGIGCFFGADFLPAYQIALPPVGYVAILSLFAVTTYVTWRYRLVDITPAFVGEQIVETMSDALLVLDREGIVRLANSAALELLGRDRDEIVGQCATQTLDSVLVNDHISALANGKQIRNVEADYERPNGDQCTLNVNASVMYDRDQKPTAFVYILCDITKRKRAEERIRFLAYYDNLTDLPNRTQFNEQLGRTLNDARAHNRKLAMFFLDLDRFKKINDTLGHAAGDQLLQAVAERLRNCVRSCDFLTRADDRESESIVARLGGDEFIVALSDIVRAEDSAIVARRMLDVLSEPFRLEQHEVFVSASVGISLYPRDGLDAQTLLKNADTAMYHAKEAGRNNYQFYQASMNVATMERLALEADLRKALEREEFELHYQPQVNYASGKVIGSEALLRWRHPVRGLLMPEDFIVLAEEAGLVPEIGEWVLRTACRQNYAWQQSGYGPMHVAVNLSERQFRQNSLVETIARALNESGMPPRSLDLELTEGIIMETSKETISTLYDLKSMGVQISVDDFGTGYSSLSYLKRFPVDVIKIDHSFVRDIVTSSDDAAIATAIIAMAHSLKLEVIAEGVETPAQCEFLIDHGCRLMQGFMFGRPLPARQFEKLLMPSKHTRKRETQPEPVAQVVQIR